MTNRDYVLKMFTLAVECEAFMIEHRADADRWLAACNAVAYCDINDPAHDALLGQQYDEAAHRLQLALDTYDFAVRARDIVLANIAKAVSDAAAYTMRDA